VFNASCVQVRLSTALRTPRLPSPTCRGTMTRPRAEPPERDDKDAPGGLLTAFKKSAQGAVESGSTTQSPGSIIPKHNRRVHPGLLWPNAVGWDRPEARLKNRQILVAGRTWLYLFISDLDRFRLDRLPSFQIGATKTRTETAPYDQRSSTPLSCPALLS
jgi:hypothetical protein